MFSVLERQYGYSYGGLVTSFARFAPSGAQFQPISTDATMDSFGIRSIERLAAGRWKVTLAELSAGFVAQVQAIEDDTTNLHDCRVESYDFVNGTFTFVHRTAAFGSLGSLALSDTVDGISIMVVARPGAV